MLNGPAVYTHRWKISAQIGLFDSRVVEVNGWLRNNSLDAVPVLQVYEGDKIATEIGLNVAHVRQPRAYFHSLVGDAVKYFSPEKALTLISNLSDLIICDPALSTLDFVGRAVFNIHTADQTLIKILSEEGEKLQREGVTRAAQKGRLTPDKALIEVTRDPTLYNSILASIDREVADYHWRVMDLSKRMAEQYQEAKLTRKRITEMMAIAEGIPKDKSTGVVREIKKLKGQLNGLFNPISQEELEKLYQEFKDNSDTKFLTSSLSLSYSSVKRMPTTLHRLANKDYDPSIVSFRMTEAWKPSSDRRKLILEANKLVMKE